MPNFRPTLYIPNKRRQNSAANNDYENETMDNVDEVEGKIEEFWLNHFGINEHFFPT